jgi:Na+-driven multidrug efflux pump
VFNSVWLAAMTATPLGFLFVVLLFWAGKWLGYAWKASGLSKNERTRQQRQLQLGRALLSNVIALAVFVTVLFFPDRLGLDNLRGLGAASAILFWGLSVLFGMREARIDAEKKDSSSPGES